MGAAKQTENQGIAGLEAAGDSIDISTFEQVLEMDDDDDVRDFSKSIVYDFCKQAESTFEKMDISLAARDLAQLSSLGHFLKGSSATLGLNKVRNSCEKIQNLGAGKDEKGNEELTDEDESLKQIGTSIDEARTEFSEVEKVLRKFYGE